MARFSEQNLDATASCPVFPVTDIAAAIAHYESLGFEAEDYTGGGYAFLRAGRAELHLNYVADLDPATSTSVCYLYVADVDGLYERWSAQGIGGHLIPPVDTDFGIREFSHIDLDGNLLRVGSALS